MPNPKLPFDNDRPPAQVEMTAERARKLAEEAESVHSTYARTQTQLYLNQIEKAANEAKRSCSLNIQYNYRDLVEKRLRQLGYTVKYYEGGQRDPGYTSVSW